MFKDIDKSELPLDQKIIIDLQMGKREPQNEKERELLKQIKEIESKGRVVYLPFD